MAKVQQLPNYTKHLILQDLKFRFRHTGPALQQERCSWDEAGSNKPYRQMNLAVIRIARARLELYGFGAGLLPAKSLFKPAPCMKKLSVSEKTNRNLSSPRYWYWFLLCGQVLQRRWVAFRARRKVWVSSSMCAKCRLATLWMDPEDTKLGTLSLEIYQG